ncbi:hypothetical protein PHYSODRAFT_489161, partial [Phytophthora sojae]
IIFTSRRLFRTAPRTVASQNGEMFGVTGTYKLHFGVWPLVSFGIFGLRYTASHACQQKVYPMAFMFVRTETAFAYTKLFSVCKQRCQEFFGVTLDLQFGSLDRSTSIANAFQTVGSEIKLLDCCPISTGMLGRRKGCLQRATATTTSSRPSTII